MPIGLKDFGSSDISIYYINYSRSLPKTFLSLTSGIRAHNVVWQGGKVARLVPFIDGAGTRSSSQLERGQAQAHEDYTNDLRKRPNKGVFQWY